MKRILLLAAFFTPSAFAQGLDYNVSVIGRTHVAAFAVAPTIGYGHMLWGERSGFMYGYLRPNLNAFASPTSYGGKASLEVYPISILGFSASRSYGSRYRNPTGYDCHFGECQGPLHSTDLSAKLLLGFGSYFLSSQFTESRYDERDIERPILDPGMAALLRADGEESRQWSFILGKKIDQAMALGLMHINVDLSEDHKAQSSQYLFVKSTVPDFAGFSLRDWSATGAVGRFESTLKPLGFSFVAVLTYSPRPSLALGN